MLRRSEDFFTKILMLIAFTLTVVIALGTVLAFSLNHENVGSRYRMSDPTPQKVVNLSNKSDCKLDAYTELGQLRAVTKSPDGKVSGTIIIITPWFSYPSADRTLYEELAQKNRKIKNIFLGYFNTYTADELRIKGERKVKAELLEAVNNELVLGEVRNLYFDNYLFIE